MVDVMSDLLVEDRYGPRTMARMITDDEQRRDERTRPADRMDSPVRLKTYNHVTRGRGREHGQDRIEETNRGKPG
jgi:hypothetical protein